MTNQLFKIVIYLLQHVYIVFIKIYQMRGLKLRVLFSTKIYEHFPTGRQMLKVGLSAKFD